MKGFSGFCLAKNGTCYFKKVDYNLRPEHTKPNPNAEGIWIWVRKGPEEVAVMDGPNWVKVPGHDIAG